jgi:exodeoxyribonuclease-3
MKLATWNVNSLKVRLLQVLEFPAAQKPDVFVLQETKPERW